MEGGGGGTCDGRARQRTWNLVAYARIRFQMKLLKRAQYGAPDFTSLI